MRQIQSEAISTPRSRRAAATLELAICLPIIVTVVLGTIEAANSIFLKQSLTIAAYEAARVASASGGTSAAAELRAQEIMNAKNLTTFQFQMTPSDLTNVTAGTQISVTITTLANANSLSPSWYSPTTKMSATMRMIRQ